MPAQPRQNRRDDDWDLGELARLIGALTVTVEKLAGKVDNLGKEFTPREVHDLALGGVKIDIRRIDEQSGKDADELRKTAGELDDRLNAQEREATDKFTAAAKKTAAEFAALERETAKRFRQLVIAIVTSVLAPLTVALVLYVLTSLPGGTS